MKFARFSNYQFKWLKEFMGYDFFEYPQLLYIAFYLDADTLQLTQFQEILESQENIGRYLAEVEEIDLDDKVTCGIRARDLLHRKYLNHYLAHECSFQIGFNFESLPMETWSIHFTGNE